MHRFNVTWVYVAACNIHGVPPLQWLEQWGRGTERPPYRGPVLHFHAPRLRTYIQPVQLFAAGAPLSAHTQPALWTGLMALGAVFPATDGPLPWEFLLLTFFESPVGATIEREDANARMSGE